MNTQFTVEEILLRYKEMLKIITNYEKNQIKSMSLEEIMQSDNARVGVDIEVRHSRLLESGGGRCRHYEE